MKKIYCVILLLCFIVFVQAEKLPQRTQISLNGIWDFTPSGKDKTLIDVPDYWDSKPEFKHTDRAVYEKFIDIPGTEEWKSKILKIDFEGVNFIADVYINDKLITSHVGGWIPFSVDITGFVKAGEKCQLKVDVSGGSHQPIVDARGYPQWPVGFVGQEGKWGIMFDVWLRAYGDVNVSDAYIQTSFRQKKISTTIELNNSGQELKNVKVISRVVPAADPGKIELKMQSKSTSIKGRETKTVLLESLWNSAKFWSPANPYLYYLITDVVDAKSGALIDRRTDRFGFRELWTEGNRLMFNGHRITLLGANIVQHSEYYDNQRYYFMTPETWNQTIDRLFELNLRTVRFHMQPTPGFILDIADERGLLIIDEAAIYAREYILEVNKKVYLENCYTWIEPWIKARRNHPSVIVWNAENEMGAGWLKWMTASEMKSLGDTIRLYDNTRPVNYDGDRDVGDAMINLHYPEGYTNTVSGSIYAWADTVNPNKPTGVGEFITFYGKEGNNNQWWQGTWVRGMRYVNFADIRPYRHDWAILRSDNTPCIENLINSLSPVALFDKEYDDLGIDPLIHGNYPLLFCGDTIHHTLILYNDEFENENIDIEVLIKSSEVYQVLYHYNGDRAPINKIVASGRGSYFVPLGEHIDIPYSFIVPTLHEGFVDGLEIELIARKKGIIKFRETKKFNLRNRGFAGETSSEVTFSTAQKPEFR
jgi:hypothetical protein